MNTSVRITRNMLAAIIGKAVIVLIGLFTFAILARHLGADGLGVYRTVLSLLALGGVCADLGIYFIMLREISSPNARQAEIIGAAMALRLVSTFSMLMLVVATVWLLPYDPIVVVGVLLASVGWTAYQGSELLWAVFQQHLMVKWATGAEIIGAASTLVLVLLIAYMGGGVLAMLAAMATGFIVTLIASWRLAVRLVPFRLRFDRAAWRNLAWVGAPVGASLILQIFILRGDTVVLSLVRSSEEVGIYSVAIKVFEIFTTVSLLFGGLIMPFFTRYAQSSKSRFTVYVEKSIEVVVLAGIASTVVFMIFADEISILLAGPEFRSTGNPLRILGLAMVVASCSHILRFAIVALHRQTDMLRVDMVAAVVALLAFVTTIPFFSYIGAAWSTLAAELVILAGLMILLARNGCRPNITPALRNAMYASIVMTVTCMALNSLNMHWLFSLLGGLGTYVVTLGINGAIPVELLRAVLTTRSPGE